MAGVRSVWIAVGMAAALNGCLQDAADEDVVLRAEVCHESCGKPRCDGSMPWGPRCPMNCYDDLESARAVSLTCESEMIDLVDCLIDMECEDFEGWVDERVPGECAAVQERVEVSCPGL